MKDVLLALAALAIIVGIIVTTPQLPKSETREVHIDPYTIINK